MKTVYFSILNYKKISLYCTCICIGHVFVLYMYLYCTCIFREALFHKKLWEKAASYVFENIYLPSAQAGSIG